MKKKFVQNKHAFKFLGVMCSLRTRNIVTNGDQRSTSASFVTRFLGPVTLENGKPRQSEFSITDVRQQICFN